MEIKLPNITSIIKQIAEIESSFEGKAQKIKKWVEEHRNEIKKNKHLVQRREVMLFLVETWSVAPSVE